MKHGKNGVTKVITLQKLKKKTCCFKEFLLFMDIQLGVLRSKVVNMHSRTQTVLDLFQALLALKNFNVESQVSISEIFTFHPFTQCLAP